MPAIERVLFTEEEINQRIRQVAGEISADFARYSPQDALCCPHATTNVLYHVATTTPPPALP